MLHDLEARGKNWHKELPPVLWALRINVNRATRDTPFNLVYGADVVLLTKIYLESTRVTCFDSEHQSEARNLESILLEERCNMVLINVPKYQESIKNTTIRVWYRESLTSKIWF
jgi:hypothetical protein